MQGETEQRVSAAQSMAKTESASVSAKNIQSNTNLGNNVSAAADRSYKTGHGLGVDWLLLLGCIFGILAMAGACATAGRHKDRR